MTDSLTNRYWRLIILTSLLVPVGGNLVADTAFRKKLAGRDTGVELQIVLEDLVASWPAPAPAPAPDTAAARWVWRVSVQ